MQSYQETFQKLGYVVIPNILPASDIQKLRSDYQTILGKYGSLTLTPREFLLKIGLKKTLLNPDVIKYCKNILSENYVMYPDFTIRQNLYIPWHTDASYLAPEIHNKNPKANFVQCSIYFQDNNVETGGGLEVIPGSHIDARVNRSNPVSSIGFDACSGEIMASKAGDLVLWDSRIVHRSVKNKNSEQLKFAMQWTMSRDDGYAKDYLNYLRIRIMEKQHVSDKEGNREEKFLTSIQEIEMCHLLDCEKEILSRNNITLSTVSDIRMSQLGLLT